MEVPSLFIEDAPGDSKNLFVRPEVFGNLSPGPLETGLRHLATFAPGDALLDRSNSMWMLRVAATPRFFKRPFESGMMGLRQT